MTISLVYCASIGLYLCLQVDWDSEVQKVMKRLQSDRIHSVSADPSDSE
jgi:MATE family multidrug resistance protein